MKKLYAIVQLLFITFLFQVKAQSQWVFENPAPEGYSWDCIDFLDSLNGKIMGFANKELVNGTWTTYPPDSQPSNIPIRLKMLSANDCWGISYYTINHFDGNSWQIVYTSPTSFTDIEFTNPSNGWVVGSNGKIFHYDGISWTLQTSPTNERLLSLYFVNDSVGYAGGENSTFLKYSNGMWTQISLSPWSNIYDIFDIAYLDTNNIYLSSILGEVLHYDGAWDLLSSPSNTNVTRTWFADSTHGWFLTRNNELIFYDGANWTIQYRDTLMMYADQAMDMKFTSATNGWVVGRFGILYHWDGISWTNLSPAFTYSPLYEIYAVDTSRVYAAGQFGIMANTGNGWHLDYTDQNGNPDFMNIDFSDANHGWSPSRIGGYFGYWNGTTWSRQYAPAGNYAINDVDAVDSNHVWAAANQRILFYDGTAWSEQWLSPGNLGNSITGISMVDTGNGYACGYNGAVMRYQNGTWSKVPGFDTTSHYYNIIFTDTNHGWMIEDFAPHKSVMHFNDGTGWNRHDTILGLSTADGQFQFRDSLNGIFASGSNVVLVYANHTWTPRFMYGTSHTISSAFFLDSLNGWVCGFAGSISRTRSGGDLTAIPELIGSSKQNILSNYPNPASESTNLEYILEKTELVQLEIYSIHGELIRTLVNREQGPGKYSVKFDTNQLSPGVYFGIIKTESRIDAVKILVNSK